MKNCVRVITLSLSNHLTESEYILNRESGFLNKKMVVHKPLIFVDGIGTSGKEQALLKFNSLCRKYFDSGYKSLDKPFDQYSTEELEYLAGNIVLDAKGRYRPMLAMNQEDTSEFYNLKILGWYVSRKLDGLRCTIYKDKFTGEIKSTSRSGHDYNHAIQHILNHSFIVSFFKNHPDIILDGEIYIHGKPLSYISELASSENNPQSNELEFWIFDYIDLDDLDEPFKSRWNFLSDLVFLYHLPWDIEEHSNCPIKMVSHLKRFTYSKIFTLQDQFVAEGFEGAIARNLDAPYEIGKRTSNMQKFKSYYDAEAVVIGLEAGFKEYEDIMFILELPNKKTFKAKPIGNIEIKKEYWNNFETKYKNKVGTYKYLSVSPEGIPESPVFKCFRAN